MGWNLSVWSAPLAGTTVPIHVCNGLPTGFFAHMPSTKYRIGSITVSNVFATTSTFGSACVTVHQDWLGVSSCMALGWRCTYRTTGICCILYVTAFPWVSFAMFLSNDTGKETKISWSLLKQFLVSCILEWRNVNHCGKGELKCDDFECVIHHPCGWNCVVDYLCYFLLCGSIVTVLSLFLS